MFLDHRRFHHDLRPGQDPCLQIQEIELNKQKENNVQLNLTIKNLENELNNLKQSKSNENTFKQDEYEKILEEKDINISQLNKSNSELNDKIVKIENEINSQKNIINEYEQNKIKLIEEKKSLIENNENLKIELNKEKEEKEKNNGELNLKIQKLETELKELKKYENLFNDKNKLYEELIMLIET